MYGLAMGKEGYLWIDRKSDKYIITLGALNGLNAGSRVSIYDQTKKIGQLAVDQSYDVISYAHPVETDVHQLQEDYYRIVIE